MAEEEGALLATNLLVVVPAPEVTAAAALGGGALTVLTQHPTPEAVAVAVVRMEVPLWAATAAPAS